MALFKGSIVAEISGSVNGIVFSRNRGGAYVRNRSVPVNPSTDQQTRIRSIFGGNASAWKALPDTVRENWRLYAEKTPLINRLGASRPIPALAMYQRCITPRVQASLSIPADAPTTPGLPNPFVFAAGGVTADEAEQEVTINFTTGQAWASQVGAAALFYLSVGQSPAVNNPGSTFRYIGRTLGAATPPTSPTVLNVADVQPIAGDLRYWLRVVVTDAEGRLSQEVIQELASVS
jgi:hypothetical protein